MNRLLMRLFGVLCKQRGTEQVPIKPTHDGLLAKRGDGGNIKAEKAP
jgi:hypothetical protein